MSDVTAHQPTENVQRGSIFALGSIVFAAFAFAIVGTIAGYITGTFVAYLVAVAAIIIPNVTLWLYRRGSGGAFATGKVPFIAITMVSILVGVFSGIVARAYVVFSAVGGDGGLFASAFWRAVSRQLVGTESLLAIGIGIALGIVGLVKILKKPATVAAPASPSTPAEPATPEATAAPAAPAAASVPAPPAPGVVLNGEPVEPDKTK